MAFFAMGLALAGNRHTSIPLCGHRPLAAFGITSHHE
jgi:hypothetical protein